MFNFVLSAACSNEEKIKLNYLDTSFVGYMSNQMRVPCQARAIKSLKIVVDLTLRQCISFGDICLLNDSLLHR
jgi:hypothetical protein